MAERGNAQKGTFACGCGARVFVAIADRPACMGIAENGSRCGFPPVRESAQLGVSLCRTHFAGYLDVLEAIRDVERGPEWIPPKSVTDWIKEMDAHRAEREPQAWAERRKLYEAQSMVYYVRIRDTIKIGYTVNMQARFAGLMVDELLATEPGGEDLEGMRHRQFAALRIRGERFQPGPDLMSHITMLREHYGEPVMTGYLTENGRPVAAGGWLRRQPTGSAAVPA
jgi:hypothetical protein